MSHLVRFGLLLVFLSAQAQDERMLRWNQFAHDANDFINTVDLHSERHEALKRKLKTEWEAVYPLL